ncbi:centrosome-associated zinc finger protein CP190 [Hyposmocoma kahamanoa]|uniref:centrosome-associated zinc finger protein CP190 n=1 Tax=Hyposmocoma kahamanoa TaxID=1477025 RepID=UPI000E6D926D|nr:centrosome-associated zinc finger protein CP190 [Hyposmocoma kahamanoa]
MSESDVKQVKVDNWGIYFLQRLKHFFNRTDYCDLTLQFQDNAQLKVHRLVLSACTEYFELLERTCEMYEDCLVMPDDLQADVVVPIVNFMYTGQLEFRLDLLERLHQTSQIMNMPVLTKLLDAHRNQIPPPKSILNFSTTSVKRSYSKTTARVKSTTASSSGNSNKRPFHKAFGTSTITTVKKPTLPKPDVATNNGLTSHPAHSSPTTTTLPSAAPKVILGEPRPTRYELPEELDSDNLFDNSFTSLSYTSQPLMVHPETTKRYVKKISLFNEASSSKIRGGSTLDIVECKKIRRNDNLFEDDSSEAMQDMDEAIFQLNTKNQIPKVTNQLFDQIIEQQDNPKITIETKDSKQTSNIDHAKIISEVLKKYPHLVKSNKNIKLKILNSPANKTQIKTNKKQRNSPIHHYKGRDIKIETAEPADYTYETDVLDSKEAARLIALGAENVKGPWICLICGTPGKALHFTTYYKFRRHLVDVHNEKPVPTICEHCGLKSAKRNYLLHHLLTKHGVEPPPSYKFPKCNLCNYIALTEGYLVKHKLTHSDVRNFRCNVCLATFNTSNNLLAHIQKTGHKYTADRRTDLQCIYCLKMFMREANLYAHLKTNHKSAARADGIIDDSDDEKQEQEIEIKPTIKFEPPSFDDSESVDAQYQIRPDGNIQLISKKQHTMHINPPTKQKILNSGYTPKTTHKAKSKIMSNISEDFLESAISVDNSQAEEIIMIDNNEYVMKDNKLVRRKTSDQYVISDMMSSEEDQNLASNTSMGFSNLHESETEENNIQEQSVVIKKANINQPIQIVVSSEEEYKALMNSNHSIIFDDGDANKTLTVLSTPQHAAINTGSIDLDNAQQNDMMIIPDTYPLNVSEALPTDNSNIVVVYSHPVDDQNKQFQIITSQDIGAQFVRTSAVITPNYDGISTSTPVMSAHVISAPVTEAWQNNIQQNQQIHMTTTSDLQEMTIIEDAEMAPAEITAINELPEVTLTPNVPQETTLEENIIQDSSVSNENIDTPAVQQVVEEEENISTTPIEVEMSSESVPNDSAVADKSLVHSNNSLTDKNPIVVTAAANEEQLIQEANIIDQGVEVIEEHSEEINEESLNLDDTVIAEIKDTDNTDKVFDTNEQTGHIQSVPIHNEEVTIPSVAKEQIQHLTSEWSEDEDDTEQEAQITEDPVKVSEVSKETAVESPVEIEESIENIQQEMEKQMTEAAVAEIDSEEGVNSQNEEDITSLHEQVTSVGANTHPVQEKISSLINDWEESVSEGNDSANCGEEEDSTPVEITEVNDPVPSVDRANSSGPPKEDKIKNLVSDWDDEDEGQSEEEPKDQS